MWRCANKLEALSAFYDDLCGAECNSLLLKPSYYCLLLLPIATARIAMYHVLLEARGNSYDDAITSRGSHAIGGSFFCRKATPRSSTACSPMRRSGGAQILVTNTTSYSTRACCRQLQLSLLPAATAYSMSQLSVSWLM